VAQQQQTTSESPAAITVASNRAQARVLRRHETNTTAIITKGIETAWGIDIVHGLARRSLHHQVEGILEANAILREQEYQNDYDDIDKVTSQIKRIHNDVQQRILASGVNGIGTIVEREAIEPDDRTTWERTKARAGRLLTGEQPDE
jgi:hypothetical protein